MSNLAKLYFSVLDISGKNYLSWVLDAETHHNAMVKQSKKQIVHLAKIK
jgi:hypothetical protein